MPVSDGPGLGCQQHTDNTGRFLYRTWRIIPHPNSGVKPQIPVFLIYSRYSLVFSRFCARLLCFSRFISFFEKMAAGDKIFLTRPPIHATMQKNKAVMGRVGSVNCRREPRLVKRGAASGIENGPGAAHRAGKGPLGCDGCAHYSARVSRFSPLYRQRLAAVRRGRSKVVTRQ